MAEEAHATDEGTEGGEASAPAKKKFGLKQILMIAIPLLLLAGGGVAFMLMHKTEKKVENAAMAAPEKVAESDDPKTPPAFMPLPDMIVNLQNERGKSTFLKIGMSLELASATDTPKVQLLLPRIIDSFQMYLRELHVDELRGSAGLYRLREELLMRVQQTVAPIKVRDVLFKDMLVQ